MQSAIFRTPLGRLTLAYMIDLEARKHFTFIFSPEVDSAHLIAVDCIEASQEAHQGSKLPVQMPLDGLHPVLSILQKHCKVMRG